MLPSNVLSCSFCCQLKRYQYHFWIALFSTQKVIRFFGSLSMCRIFLYIYWLCVCVSLFFSLHRLGFCLIDLMIINKSTTPTAAATLTTAVIHPLADLVISSILSQKAIIFVHLSNAQRLNSMVHILCVSVCLIFYIFCTYIFCLFFSRIFLFCVSLLLST